MYEQIEASLASFNVGYRSPAMIIFIYFSGFLS